MIYWFIGQPGCGKTTLAKELKKWMDGMHIPAIHLDGDDLRVIFGGTYKTEHFSKEYRDTNTRKLQRFAEHIDKQGINVIVSTVNSARDLREELKLRNPKAIEVYVVNDGPHVREEYARIDFEAPLENFIKLNTNGRTPQESFNVLLTDLVKETCKRNEETTHKESK